MTVCSLSPQARTAKFVLRTTDITVSCASQYISIYWIEFCTGVKSRRKPREYRRSRKNDHPSSRGSAGTVCCRNPAGPGVKGVLLRGTGSHPRFPSSLLLLLFGLCLPLSLYLSCFRFSVHFRQFSEWIRFLMCIRFYAAWYELRT